LNFLLFRSDGVTFGGIALITSKTKPEGIVSIALSQVVLLFLEKMPTLASAGYIKQTHIAI
jgi:hypothetical protein